MNLKLRAKLLQVKLTLLGMWGCISLRLEIQRLLLRWTSGDTRPAVVSTWALCLWEGGTSLFLFWPLPCSPACHHWPHTMSWWLFAYFVGKRHIFPTNTQHVCDSGPGNRDKAVTRGACPPSPQVGLPVWAHATEVPYCGELQGTEAQGVGGPCLMTSQFGPEGYFT